MRYAEAVSHAHTHGAALMPTRPDDTDSPTSPPPRAADPAAATLLSESPSSPPARVGARPGAPSLPPTQPAGAAAAPPLPSLPGYGVARRAGPRREWGSFTRPAGGLRPNRRRQDDPVRFLCGGGRAGGFCIEACRPSPACKHPTSSRSTRSANTTAGPSSRWSSAPAGRSTKSWAARRCPRKRPPPWWRRWRAPCGRRTRRGWCIGT